MNIDANSVAILMTSFNRRESTLRCLRMLFSSLANAVVFLVDDNSSDGTSHAVKLTFPSVHLIQGTGDLFWNRGMHLAWEHARRGKYDFYVLLNDDVCLYDNSFMELFACSKITSHQSIITGIVMSHDGIDVLYGGTDTRKKILEPTGTMQAVTNMNGNVVLIPSCVFDKLGNLNPYFHHDLGDVDYGLRAQRENIKIFTTRVAIGTCDRNCVCRIRLWGSNIFSRFTKLYSPLGSPPLINFNFRRLHYGFINASMYFVFLHLINVLPDSLVRIFFGNKYIPG